MLTTHIGKFWWKFSFQNNHLVGRILINTRWLFWKLNFRLGDCCADHLSHKMAGLFASAKWTWIQDSLVLDMIFRDGLLLGLMFSERTDAGQMDVTAVVPAVSAQHEFSHCKGVTRGWKNFSDSWVIYRIGLQHHYINPPATRICALWFLSVPLLPV